MTLQMLVTQQLAIAVEFHRAGRLADAAELYARIIATDPQQADAWKLLGVVLSQQGDQLRASEHLQRAAELSGRRDPTVLVNLAEVYRLAGHGPAARDVLLECVELVPQMPEAWNNLGTVHRQLGEALAAENAYRRAIQLEPNYSEAWNNLGTLLRAGGHYREAEACLTRATTDPRFAVEVFYNLGLVKRDLHKLTEAVECFERVTTLAPQQAEGFAMLGVVYSMQGQWTAAEMQLRRALALQPQAYAEWNNLGLVLHNLGRFDDSAEALREALRYRPDDADSHNNYAATLRELGQIEAARSHFQRALELRPDYAEAHNNLGLLYLGVFGDYDQAEHHFQAAIRSRGDYSEAYDHLGVLRMQQGHLAAAHGLIERALQLNPASAEAHNNLGNLLVSLGDASAARTEYAAALQFKPGFVAAESNRLLGMLYDPNTTLAELLHEHQAWGTRLRASSHGFATPRNHNDWPQSRVPDRPLRIGFVSSDLGRHPVGFILLPLVEHLDRQQFFVTCYSQRPYHDTVEERLMRRSDCWRFGNALGESQLIEQIRDDQIDILFDLAGHTALNRIKVFAARPAPVQVTWAGYPSTTGLDTIDYLLTDRQMLPVESARFMSERVAYLPEAAWCCGIFDEYRSIPAAEPHLRRPLTLASFNNPAKLSHATIALWSRVLRRVAGARLLLKFRGLDDPAMAVRLRERFAAAGVDGDRIEFRGATPFEQMLHEYHEVDVALDPIPFGGGITSLVALWMGVPVVTWPGETIASRQTFSMLTASGIPATIATSAEHYVEIVAELAADPERLAMLRTELRPKIEQTAFLQAERFVPAWSRVVRQMWIQWCCES